MAALGLVEAENPGEGVEDLLGGLRGAALLQAHVVVDADPGQVRDLLTAQPLHTAAAVGGDADGGGIDPGAPGAQEAREIVHGPQYGFGPVRQGGPAGTRKSRPTEAAPLHNGTGPAQHR